MKIMNLTDSCESTNLHSIVFECVETPEVIKSSGRTEFIIKENCILTTDISKRSSIVHDYSIDGRFIQLNFIGDYRSIFEWYVTLTKSFPQMICILCSKENSNGSIIDLSTYKKLQNLNILRSNPRYYRFMEDAFIERFLECTVPGGLSKISAEKLISHSLLGNPDIEMRKYAVLGIWGYIDSRNVNAWVYWHRVLDQHHERIVQHSWGDIPEEENVKNALILRVMVRYMFLRELLYS